MKIAVVMDKNRNFMHRLSEILGGMNWGVDFFYGSTDFGLAEIASYDIIIADLDLKPIDGRQILRSIQNKTTAELFLMGTSPFSEIDVYNDNIKGLIDKNDIEGLVDKLHYVDVKKHIQNSISSIQSGTP